MGVSTSPSKAWSWWWWWIAVVLIMSGTVLLVSPIRVRPPLPDPVFNVDLTLLALLVLASVAFLLFVAYGPYADWRHQWRRRIGVAIGLAGLALAIVALLSRADILAVGLMAGGWLVALVGWFLDVDPVFRPPKDPQERQKQGWKCTNIGVGGVQCERTRSDGTKEVWTCDRTYEKCIEGTIL
jgi:hypothetical protein